MFFFFFVVYGNVDSMNLFLEFFLSQKAIFNFEIHANILVSSVSPNSGHQECFCVSKLFDYIVKLF